MLVTGIDRSFSVRKRDDPAGLLDARDDGAGNGEPTTCAGGVACVCPGPQRSAEIALAHDVGVVMEPLLDDEVVPSRVAPKPVERERDRLSAVPGSGLDVEGLAQARCA